MFIFHKGRDIKEKAKYFGEKVKIFSRFTLTINQIDTKASLMNDVFHLSK